MTCLAVDSLGTRKRRVHRDCCGRDGRQAYAENLLGLKRYLEVRLRGAT